MATAVVMPKAGISVESCIIGNWKKKPGDTVSVGDVLFDYETDKAAFDCESTAEGVLLEVFFSNGEEVPVLTPVCAVGQPGEDASGLRPDADAPAAQPQSEQTPAQPDADVSAQHQERQSCDGSVKISPRARRLALEMELDPAGAVATGPYGRIIERDIRTLASSGLSGSGIGGRASGQPSQEAADVSVQASGGGYTDQKFSGIRNSIAKSMMSSLTNSAQLTHHHSFDASAILDYRKLLKESGDESGLKDISLNDIILFAVSRTLRNHPDLNAHLLNGDTMRRFQSVHIGIAVDTPRGLMVPTIFDADEKSLAEISCEAKSLTAMTKSGGINPDLLQGATFTVSNLGSLGVEMFTPILNPPQVAILGVCGISDRVRRTGDGIEAYPAMGLSLTYDHRAVDGAPASRFVRDLCRNLENFQLLLAI